MRLSNVTAQPVLTYELAVPGLGHTSASVTFLDEGEEGTLRLAFDPSTLQADRVEAEQYDGVLRVIATDDAGRRVLAETDVTVEVRDDR